MPNNPYTEKQRNQFRGPADSEKFNQFNDDVYQDLVYLYNALKEANADIDERFSATIKDMFGIEKEIESIKSELAAIQDDSKTITFSGNGMVDTDQFDSTSYEIPDADRLYYDSRFGTYTLPRVSNNSISRVKFNDVDGEASVPPSLKMVVSPDLSSVDQGDNVRTSLPYDAIVGDPGTVWERNVLSDNDSGEAIVDLMFNLPDDLTATEYANCINLVPFPVYDVDILGIYFTTQPSPNLSKTNAAWTPLNKNSNYYNDSEAVGKIPPGAWSGDEIVHAGPSKFVFPNEKITAMRITLRQQNPYDGSSDVGLNKYVYSYGLSTLDVRYDKFNTSGKLIFRLDPNGSDTISSIDSVTPEIYNVSASGIPDVFSYRVIWETSFESGTYTTTPVPLSNRVWLEITLSKDSLENLPALTGFSVTYS